MCHNQYARDSAIRRSGVHHGRWGPRPGPSYSVRSYYLARATRGPVSSRLELDFGTPVRMPSKLESIGPTLIRPWLKVNSRSVRSCGPLRFFTTEMACLTSPLDSKYRKRTTESAR